MLVRLVGALGVVLLTYNPTGYSFYHWALRDLVNITALKAFAGALLLAGWVICIRAAFISLGRIGLVLSALVLGTLVWVLTDYGVLDPDRPESRDALRDLESTLRDLEARRESLVGKISSEIEP